MEKRLRLIDTRVEELMNKYNSSIYTEDNFFSHIFDLNEIESMKKEIKNYQVNEELEEKIHSKINLANMALEGMDNDLMKKDKLIHCVNEKDRVDLSQYLDKDYIKSHPERYKGNSIFGDIVHYAHWTFHLGDLIKSASKDIRNFKDHFNGLVPEIIKINEDVSNLYQKTQHYLNAINQLPKIIKVVINYNYFIQSITKSVGIKDQIAREMGSLEKEPRDRDMNRFTRYVDSFEKELTMALDFGNDLSSFPLVAPLFVQWASFFNIKESYQMKQEKTERKTKDIYKKSLLTRSMHLLYCDFVAAVKECDAKAREKLKTEEYLFYVPSEQHKKQDKKWILYFNSEKEFGFDVNNDKFYLNPIDRSLAYTLEPSILLMNNDVKKYNLKLKVPLNDSMSNKEKAIKCFKNNYKNKIELAIEQIVCKYLNAMNMKNILPFLRDKERPVRWNYDGK